MPLMFHNGQLLFRNGALAMSADCCCHGSDSDSDSDTDCLESRCTLTITIEYTLSEKEERDTSNTDENAVLDWIVQPQFIFSFLRDGEQQKQILRNGDGGLLALSNPSWPQCNGSQGQETPKLSASANDVYVSGDGDHGEIVDYDLKITYTFTAIVDWPGTVELYFTPNTEEWEFVHNDYSVTYPGVKYTKSVSYAVSGCSVSSSNSVNPSYSTSSHSYGNQLHITTNIM